MLEMRGEIITREEVLAIPAYEISDLGQIAPEPLVSVIVITYNHEAYIEQTIEGILAQQCDFPIELIIGEDKSKDRTLEICLSYQQKYPNIIRVVSWHENIGATANFLRVWSRARGKYLAICEGDDYWIDSAKLKKQVAIMEQMPDVTLCGARTRVLVEVPGRKPEDRMIGSHKRKINYSLKEILHTYPFHTSTHLIRKSALLFPKFLLPQYGRPTEYLDNLIQCICLLGGRLQCLPDVVSIYRQHPRGMCLGNSQEIHFARREALFKALLDILDEGEAPMVRREMDFNLSRRCHYLVNEGKIDEARILARGLLWRLARHDCYAAALLLLHICLPETYAFIRGLGKGVLRKRIVC